MRFALKLPEHPGLWVKRPPSHLGRRGAVLLILGVIWFFIGISTLVDPYAAGGPNLGLFHEALPPWIRLALWCTSGVIAIASSWRVASRRDDWGYMALIAMPLVRVSSYMWAWVLHLIGQVGDPAGWVGGAVWATVAVLVYTISGWPETPSFVLPVEGDDGPTEGDTP